MTRCYTILQRIMVGLTAFNGSLGRRVLSLLNRSDVLQSLTRVRLNNSHLPRMDDWQRNYYTHLDVLPRAVYHHCRLAVRDPASTTNDDGGPARGKGDGARPP
jgi:hypothetical protein